VIIGVDFDNTIVAQSHPYDDVTSPLQFLPGARAGLHSLKAAGHTLILFSARASRSLLFDEDLYAAILDPDFNLPPAGSSQDVQIARFVQMIDFVERELPGIFAAVTSDKGRMDLFLDDKAQRLGYSGMSWEEVARNYGEPVEGLLEAVNVRAT
jgi:hypothetical protein